MESLIYLVLANLEKIGLGIAVFLCAYLSNMGLGAWKSVKIDGKSFDWSLILSSLAKFAVLIFSLGLLSMTISVLPAYITYVGIEVDPSMMEAVDSLVIVATFLTATLRYVADAVAKVKDLF